MIFIKPTLEGATEPQGLRAGRNLDNNGDIMTGDNPVIF